MADLLDLRLSLMMHIKIKVFHGIIKQNIIECVRVIALFFTVANFMSVALIVVEKTCVLTLYITVVNSL